ncbi:MAG: methyl-accepting chemotaxis protein [Ghiorsea sp.]
MFDILKLASMRGKAIGISVMMLMALLFLTYTSLDISSAFRATGSVQLININMQKQFLMNRMMSSLGYGGAIQAFKDYELRRKDKFQTRSLEALAESKSLVESYLKLGEVSEQEIEKLGQVLELIGLLKSSLLPIQQMLKERVASTEIDKQLAVEYGPYRASIDALLLALKENQEHELQRLKQYDPFLENQFSILSHHISMLNSLSQNMGYGGVIHLYKNYVLHGSQSSNQAYASQLEAVRGLVESLKESDLNVGEDNNALFEALTQLPQRYADAMKKQIRLRSEGVSFHKLVFKGKIKKDGDYIQQINQLNNMLTQQFIVKQEQSHIYLDHLVQTSQQRLMIAMVIIFICIALAIYVFAIQMPRLMRQSIHAVRASTDDKALEMNHLIKRKDEFGNLAYAIEASANELVEMEVNRQRLAAVEQERVDAEMRKGGILHREQLADDFEKTLGVIITEVSSYVSQAYQQAKIVNDMSAELMAQSEHANDSSQESIILVESTENASSDIQHTALDIGEKSQHAYSLAGEVMQRTDAVNIVIARLNVVSQSIGSVVQSISGIAKNTRLLSMNATIEGASAGEAGKGFAVVANEVKELSAESAKAVEHIRKEISDMQTEISETANLLVEMTQKISAVHASSLTVSDSVSMQVEAIQGVAQNAAQASHRMQDVVRVIDVLSHAAGESEHSSIALHDVIEKMDVKMKEAELSLQDFLLGMRDAG